MTTSDTHAILPVVHWLRFTGPPDNNFRLDSGVLPRSAPTGHVPLVIVAGLVGLQAVHHPQETNTPMVTSSRKILDLDALRDFVHAILCDRDQLVRGAFKMTERLLLRSGQPCGMYFCLHGPRSVKFSAIWDARDNSVLFYGATGERFYKTQLEDELEVALPA